MTATPVAVEDAVCDPWWTAVYTATYQIRRSAEDNRALGTSRSAAVNGIVPDGRLGVGDTVYRAIAEEIA